MRILGLSDSHFDERSPRWAECVRIHDWAVDTVRHEKPDLVVHPGDVYERASTPLERLAVADVVQRITEWCPLIIVRGNHEKGDKDLDILARLETRHPVHVVETVGVVRLRTARGEDLAVGCLAWPSYGSSLDVSEARTALSAAFAGLGLEMDEHPGDSRLLLTHAAVDGAIVSTGQPLVGGGLNVSLSDLALARAQAVVMGHIHKPQSFELAGGAPAFYIGSPYRTSFGETERKSLVDIRIERGRLTWSRIETPARAMHLLEGDWQDGQMVMAPFGGDEPLEMASADVRFRYTVAVEHREPARLAARALEAAWREQGAATVQVESEVAVTTRVRNPEIAAARTLPDKIQAFWNATNNVPTPTVAARLLGPRLEQLGD